MEEVACRLGREDLRLVLGTGGSPIRMKRHRNDHRVLSTEKALPQAGYSLSVHVCWVIYIAHRNHFRE
jgi:hypothetical protein